MDNLNNTFEHETWPQTDSKSHLIITRASLSELRFPHVCMQSSSVDVLHQLQMKVK